MSNVAKTKEINAVELSPAFLDAVHRDTGSAAGLPSRAYTSDAFFALERDRLMARTWACVSFAGDLPASGDARPVVLMGLPLLLLRDGEQIRVFHNVCSHRGHMLVDKPCKLQGSVRCPYHSWMYGLDGRLRGTPHAGGPGVHEVPGFDRDGNGLKPVRSAVWFNLIFVNLDGQAPAFANHIAPVVDRWRPFWGADGLDQLRPAASHGRVELEVQANWKLAVENHCEAYHLPWIHPELNRISKLEDHYPITCDSDATGAAAFSGQGSHAYNLVDTTGITLPTFPHWPVDRQRTAEYLSFYPNALIGLQTDHAWTVILEPLAPNLTREHLQLYFMDAAANGEDYRAVRAVVQASWREVFGEDVRAVEGMQRGRGSPAFQGGTFSAVMDQPTHHFHRWVADRLAANPSQTAANAGGQRS